MATKTAPIINRKTVLENRIRLIVFLTISWNVIEAIVAILAGKVASSAALVGFGLDSIVEVLSAGAIAWQFSSPNPQQREKIALKVIAISFFGLAIYVSIDAVLALAGFHEAQDSYIGIFLAGLSLVVMPFLSWWERKTGRELGSQSAIADSKQTLMCAYLSAALLIGLVLNAWLGWSWADCLAAFIIAIVAIREGINAWNGKVCCNSMVGQLSDTTCSDDSCSESKGSEILCTDDDCKVTAGSDTTDKTGPKVPVKSY